MKNASSARKTARNNARSAGQRGSAGPEGVAIAPPAYGIDGVDHEVVADRPDQTSAPASLESATWSSGAPLQRKPVKPGAGSKAFRNRDENKTGLPDKLKAGIETLSGLSMADVKVHYNSAKPARLQAMAYTQGADIHVGPGQERHLPHEAWHVVQQKQGRVKPPWQAKGMAINNDQALEREADTMAGKVARREVDEVSKPVQDRATGRPASPAPIQRKVYIRRNLIHTWREKTKTSRGQAIKELIAADKSYYFHNKDEMEDYAQGRSEGLGFLGDTWIRLGPQLTVLGETHTSDKNALSIAKATKTERFLHEGYTKAPAEEIEGLADLMAARKGVMDQKSGSAGRLGHEAEDFLPKTLRGLRGIMVQYNCQLYGSRVEALLTRMAMIYAKGCDPGSILNAYYRQNQEIFDATIDELGRDISLEDTTLSTRMKAAKSSALWDDFMSTYVDYVTPIIQQARATASEQDQNTFDSKWRVAPSGDYGSEDKPIMQAERMRDFSMYQHIKKAQADRFLLYGLGSLHHERLAKVLDEENINHDTVTHFLAEQGKEHKQE